MNFFFFVQKICPSFIKTSVFHSNLYCIKEIKNDGKTNFRCVFNLLNSGNRASRKQQGQNQTMN